MIMKAALCGECRDFLQSNHDNKRQRFMNSPVYERPTAVFLGAVDSGCHLCGAVAHKFRTCRPELLSLAQINGQPVTFRLSIRPYENTNLQCEEDIDRPFLLVSILQSQLEFRLWRVADARGHTAQLDDVAPGALACNDHGTSSETSFGTAAEWLRECMMEHTNCNRVNAPDKWAPTRLLDVGLGSTRAPFPDVITLQQTKSWQTPIQYATLSHCWGAIQPLRLLQSNLPTLRDGILLGDLPESFQDAVHTVRKLGIRYLWIDSLCIIQDSKEDWDRESYLMAHVYGGCVLNIAAAASDDCTGGLFQSRPPSYLGPCLLSVESENGALISQYQLWDQDLWHVEFEDAKLNTRAWVMQERMLSPRTLAFTKAQLFWECRRKRASEEFPSEYPVEHFEKRQRRLKQTGLRHQLKIYGRNLGTDGRVVGDDHRARLSLAWHNLVMRYSTKDITFEQDKLVAVSGLAVLFAGHVGADYLAGLWKSTLLDDLLWEVHADKHARYRPLAYRAPSWSWASVKCPVKYLPGRIESQGMVAVVDVKVERAPKTSQFGRVLCGYLRIQAKLFPHLSIMFGVQPPFQYSLGKRGSEEASPVASCTPDDSLSSADTEESELLCLPFGSYWDSTRAMGGWHYEFRGLVLSPERDQPRGYYRRWGIFQATQSAYFRDRFNEAPPEFYLDGEEDTVVIL